MHSIFVIICFYIHFKSIYNLIFNKRVKNYFLLDANFCFQSRAQKTKIILKEIVEVLQDKIVTCMRL